MTWGILYQSHAVHWSSCVVRIGQGAFPTSNMLCWGLYALRNGQGLPYFMLIKELVQENRILWPLRI